MKLKYLSLILFPTLLLAQNPKSNQVKELDVNNFAHGIDTYHDSAILPDGYVQDGLNIYFDRQAPIEKRQGYTVAFTTKAYSFNTTWTYTDGTNTTWLLVRASDSVIASNLTGTIVKVSTLSLSDNVDEVNAFGNAYFVDPTQGVYYWNGSSTSYISGSPKGSIIAQFHNRVWVAGQAVPNGNLLNASKFLDGTTWATGLNPNDPVQFTIGLQDNFDNITALYPFLDTLYVTKYTSIYALYGFDNTNFQNSIINRECGCVDKYSIQAFNKGMVFVSLRGLEFFDGYNCNRISDPVKNKIDSAISLTSFNQNTWLQSTASDWQAGTFNSTSSLSTTIAAPALTLQSETTNYSSINQFAGGTFNATSWDGTGVSINTSNSSPVNGGFESGDTNWYTLTGHFGSSLQSNGTNCNIVPRGTKFGRARYLQTDVPTPNLPTTIHVQLLRCLDNAVVSSLDFSATSNNCTWTQQTLSENGLKGECVYINITNDIVGTITYYTAQFIASGTNITFYTTSDTLGSGAPTGMLLGLDDFTDGVNLISSGTYTSPVFDTISSNNTFLGTATWNTSGTSHPPAIVFQNSDDQVTWSDLSTSTGSNVTSSKRYMRFISSFTNDGNANRDVTEQLTGVTETVSTTSGTFKTAIHGLGSLTSWGNFNVTDNLNNGNIAFSVCSSTNSDMSKPTNCAVQTPNTPVTITTGTYAQWYATFTVTAATQTPILNSGTLQWYVGSRISPMASVVHDNRYILAITTNPANTVNDTEIILNTMGAFSLFNIRAGGLVSVKNNLYHADSTATGNIYLDNQGYNDNGNAITAFVRTKDYNLSNRVVDTLFDSLWPSMINLGNYNVSFAYALDKGITDYSLATVNQNEFASTKFARINFPMSSSNPGIAQTVNFKISASDSNEPFQFEGLSLLYHERPIQE